MKSPSITLKDFTLIFLAAFFWSFSYIIIRIADLSYTHPFNLTLFRTIFASIILLIFCLCTKMRFYTSLTFWKPLIISSLLLNVIPFTCCSIGERTVDSSNAAIIENSNPNMNPNTNPKPNWETSSNQNPKANKNQAPT